MKYVEFRDVIRTDLVKHPEGRTWKELKASLNLPYERPCPTWISRLEQEIRLKREKHSGAALRWRISD